jgi:hypothetical protein
MARHLPNVYVIVSKTRVEHYIEHVSRCTTKSTPPPGKYAVSV